MTEQEFKDYIADDVLVGIRSEMGWEYTKVPDTVTKRYSWAGTQTFGTATYIGKYPWGIHIPSGATVNLLAGGTVTLAQAIYEDSMQLVKTTTTAEAGAFYYDVTVIPDHYVQSIKSYNAILNETLIRLGTNDITTVDEDKARAFGRVEAWRHIMWATAADYDYASATGGFSRRQNHINAIAQLTLETQHVGSLYGQEIVPRIPATSYQSKIRGVWK